MYDVVVVYPLRIHSGVTEVLLGEKKSGLGTGRIVGPGGKVEPGEGLIEAALRELREEVGLQASGEDLVPIARISYPFLGRPHLSQRSHAFMLPRYLGEVVESEELSPQWWSLDQIPFHRMWADASLWLPQALGGQFQEATITIGDVDEVLSLEWVDQTMSHNLADADLNQLRERMEQLDNYARAIETQDANTEELRATVFPDGDHESDWNDYHRVRNEYDRRAAEEFDLGQ